MTHYGAKDLAAAFRTVRNNTIKIAEEIGEEHYDFRATPDTRSVAETLIHVAHLPEMAHQMHGVQHASTVMDFDFMGFILPRVADEKVKRPKADILKMLADGRDQYAGWLDGLSHDFLNQQVSMPPGAQPPTKSRFDMLLGVKEHEMHHRAQLMVLERMLGMVPHLTRQMEATRAQFAARASKP